MYEHLGGPLGCEVPGSDPSSGETPPSPRTKAYNAWLRILRLLSNSSAATDFTEKLKPVQQRSLDLLLSWWTQPNAQQYLKKAAETTRVHLRFVETTAFAELVTLWEAEFLIYLITPLDDVYMTGLQDARSTAAQWAACNRLTRIAVQDLSLANWYTGPPKRGILDNYVNSSILPCPWLGGAVQELHLPHYLWDIKRAEIVTRETFGDGPDYYAVSHTWGRWQTGKTCHISNVPWPIPQNSRFEVKDLPTLLRRLSGLTTYVWFDLLCIPQDRSILAIQEIGRQASIFKLAAGAVGWMNDIEDWEGVKEALAWLSIRYTKRSLQNRSGDRFMKASLDQHAVDTLGHKATGFYESFKHVPDGIGPDTGPSGYFTSLWTLQESCMKPDMLLCDKQWRLLNVGHGTPVTLASLIFLADTCKSPRVEAEFEVQDLNSIEILQTRPVLEASRTDTIVPRGGAELLSLFGESAMNDLPRLSQLSVLILGNQRYCQKNRAEAIMSVLGVTDWLNNRVEILKQSSWEDFGDNLILGRYPLTFLHELRAKMGATFFSAFSQTGEEDREGALSAERLPPEGSLLPFTYNRGSLRFTVDYGIQGARDHPAVAKWSILPTGSVNIREAGIVASYMPDTTCKKAFQTVDIYSVMRDAEDPELGRVSKFEIGKNLQEWLESVYRGRQLYVVCLLQSTDATARGIILEHVHLGSNTYLKVGNYIEEMTVDWDNGPSTFPKIENVDWHVL